MKAAAKHANWDLITEYNFLPTPLTEPLSDDLEDVDDMYMRNDPLELNNYELGKPSYFISYKYFKKRNKLMLFYSGVKGKLKKVYHTTLAYWFQFALDLSVPAIKKHVVKLERRHALPVILKELQNLVHSHALDTTARTFIQWSKQPFIEDGLTQDELLLSKIVENADGNVKWLSKAAEQENTDDLIFLPYDVNKENQSLYVRSILIARNFSQWKASSSDKIESEQLIPKGMLLFQINERVVDINFNIL